jgi:hypothetical protein
MLVGFVTLLKPCNSFGTFGKESGIFVLVYLNATLVCRKPETKRPLHGTYIPPLQRHTLWPFREIRISATEIAFRFWEELQLGRRYSASDASVSVMTCVGLTNLLLRST